MTALVTRFGLIGRSYPMETFEGLHQASVAARAERRTLREDRPHRIWRGASEPVALPKRLFA